MNTETQSIWGSEQEGTNSHIRYTKPDFMLISRGDKIKRSLFKPWRHTEKLRYRPTRSSPRHWISVLSFTPRPLYPSESVPGIYWIGGWVGPTHSVDGFGENKNILRRAGNRIIIRLLSSPQSSHYSDRAIQAQFHLRALWNKQRGSHSTLCLWYQVTFASSRILSSHDIHKITSTARKLA
jgi:hypothetical protein